MPYYGLYISCFQGLEFGIIYPPFRFLSSNSPKVVISRGPDALFQRLSYQLANLDVYLRQCATWKGLPPQMRTKLIDDRKKHINQMLQESTLVQDQESRPALKEKEAAGYVDLEVSGDEESKVEDIYSDPKVGESS